MGTDTHARVEDNDALERRTKGKDTVSLVILLLLADEQYLNAAVLHHILNLLFRAGSIERNTNNPHAVSSEVGVQILNTVLREHRNTVLRLQSKVQHSIGHLFNS